MAEPIVKVRNLRKSYGKVGALKGISFGDHSLMVWIAGSAVLASFIFRWTEEV